MKGILIRKLKLRILLSKGRMFGLWLAQVEWRKWSLDVRQ